jgi:hypothetical protein
MTRSIPVRVNAAALLLAIISMIIQIASGVKYPTVPPGIVILAATALLVALVPWPAIRLLGVLAPLFILIGGIVSTTGRTNLSQLAHLGKFVGSLIQLGALALAVIAGIAAVLEWRRSRTDAGPVTLPVTLHATAAPSVSPGREA